MSLVSGLLLTGALPVAQGAHSSRAAVLDATPTLDVLYIPDGTISVTLDGTPVGAPNPPGTVIPPGLYDLYISNPTGGGVDHVFDLSGPGVDVVTDLFTAGVDNMSVPYEVMQVTFLPNSTYVYQDDLHPTAIHEVFSTSGAVAASSAPGSASSGSSSPGGSSTGTTSGAASKNGSGGTITGSGTSGTSNLGSIKKVAAAKPIPFRGTLTGTVSAAGTLSLTHEGKPVTRLTTGRYTVSVIDKTSKDGFVLQEINRPAVTVAPVGFVGKRSLSVDLTAGQWFFYPTFIGKKTYFIVVS